MGWGCLRLRARRARFEGGRSEGNKHEAGGSHDDVGRRARGRQRETRPSICNVHKADGPVVEA